MSGLFGPKAPNPVIPVDPSNTQNRMNSALGRLLGAGGTNADLTTQPGQAQGNAPRMGTLTGIS